MAMRDFFDNLTASVTCALHGSLGTARGAYSAMLIRRSSKKKVPYYRGVEFTLPGKTSSSLPGLYRPVSHRVRVIKGLRFAAFPYLPILLR